LRGSRLVVGDIVDLLRPVAGNGRAQYRRNIINVDAIKNLACFDDTPCRSLLQTVYGAAAWPIDSSKPENLNAPVCVSPERAPGLLYGETTAASR
jgi:hypothetical protein